jgi:hypothetical protein
MISDEEFDWISVEEIEKKKVVVRLRSMTSDSSAVHILVDSQDEALCGYHVREDVDVISDTSDPIDLLSSPCADCEIEWREMRAVVERETTVECRCSRHRPVHDLTSVLTIVPVSRARGLKHPNYETEVPLCRSCYIWIADQDNPVSEPFSDAEPYLVDDT